MKPITPEEFKKAYGSKVPEIVIETVNQLLQEASSYEDKKYIYLKQDKVVDALVAKGIDRQTIFRDHYLDFEPEFRKAGWKVEWYKGAYYEESSANHWTFTF